jgi:DNA-binding HxlR family transcriptional regulator
MAQSLDLRLQGVPAEGLQAAVGVLAAKWSVAVIAELSLGTQRFTELLRAIDGVSRRMLAATLRGLERDGLVERRVFAHVPARVEYELSPAGEELLLALAPLAGWGVEHTRRLQRARDRYDRMQDSRDQGQELQARTQATPRIV